MVTYSHHAWCYSMFTSHLPCASMEDLRTNARWWVLIRADRRWSVLIGADPHWSALKENSYKVGVCFFQVGVQIRRQVSWLNYYSARLFCWIAQRKVDTDASALMSLSLLSIFGTSCCSCIHIICYNMTSTIYDPFCSCIIIETYLADRAAITFVQNKPRLQTKVYLFFFYFAH